MTTTPATNPRRQRPARTAALIGTLASALLLSGCGTALWETGLDMRVYFNNTTDQTLELRLRNQLGKSQDRQLKPHQTSAIQLVPKGECYETTVITDESGTIVKDPGQVCWHDTITIP